KDLRHTLYDEKVIGLGYTSRFLIHSDEALEIKKFKRARENKIEFAYDYGSLNASYVNEKINFSDDYFLEIINPDFKTIDSPFQQTSSLKLVRRPKPSGVMWKKKGSSNTIKADLSSVNHLNSNKNVKRYSCKDLMLCNNSYLRDTRSAHACNNARNAYCNSYDVDVNDLFVFDDKSLRKSQVTKMPFRKKPHASLNMSSKSKSIKSLPRIVLRFGNNDFAVIAGYGDVVIGSMTIKRVYYVEGLGHNLFSVGQFYDKGLEVAFRKSTCFVRNENGVDLLTGDCSSNLYTIALNEIASNSSNCLLAKASSLKSWLWHQHLSHLNFVTINNLVKNNLVRGDQ
nr:integrase, catalytic region, zinc finger, CCHC-type, peptidase aspartic, catalytic [Tanacetum cinerariifolium]